jgi:hypothetical protein
MKPDHAIFEVSMNCVARTDTGPFPITRILYASFMKPDRSSIHADTLDDAMHAL